MQNLKISGDRVLLQLNRVSKYYGQPESRILILDSISFGIKEGEFAALLGHSGSGKSTLLRIVTGLTAPSTGQVLYRNQVLKGINPHASLVFQSFALYPWFTALENVELALKVKGLPLPQRRQRALELLDMVGLDGFEDAYPRELSGGMRQKVGFARALAVEPELLCMDEPFSSLDVLSAETLRGELMELWLGRKLPTKAILMVTHNIEEAVLLADRAIVLSKNPGRVIADFPIPLSYPRERKSRGFTAIVDRIYRIITQGAPALAIPELAEEAPLPHAAIDTVTGLVERVAAGVGREDLYRLAAELQMEVDDLLPVTGAAERLGLGRVEEGDFVLSPLGLEFAAAEVLVRKELLRPTIAQDLFIQRIVQALEAAEDHSLPEELFLEALYKGFSEEEARAQLETAVDWGRYAELFTYDRDSRELYIEQG
ncbi:MAG: AAA-associated domain-containing protein [Chloroflexi bacterium]|nr:AAA-associated domain-containing protein [Chloroflexota bacterium]